MEAVFATIKAAFQAMRAFQDTNAPFNACMPLASTDKTLAALKCFALFGLVTGFGQDDALDTHLLRKRFIVRRIDAAICAGLLRGMAEEFFVRFEAGLPLLRVRRVAMQDAITADNSSVYFIEPDLMTVLNRFCFFAATDNVRMWLKDADDFFLRGNLLMLKHAPFGLIDHFFGEGDEVFQRAGQAFGVLVLHFLEMR